MACIVQIEKAAFREGGGFPEPGIEPNYPPSRTCRIRHAELHLHLEPAAQRFEGSVRLHLVATPIFDGSWSVDAEEMEIVSVRDDTGEDLAHRPTERGIVVHGPVPAWVEIHFRGARPSRGLYFTGPSPQRPDRAPMAWSQCQDEDSHFVFPCHDHPGARHTWDITVSAPAGNTVLSNGARLGEEVVGDRVVGRFAVSDPMPAYLVTAVAAKLTVLEANWRGVPVRYLVPVGEEAYALAAMGRTPEMMELFSTRTGVPYPWPRYDQVVVHDFVFGGMENTACTTMMDLLLVDPKGAVEWEADQLVAHELAHQWFGDLVTCQDWSQGWLNESWATVMEAVWWEHSRPADALTWYRWQMAAGYFDEHNRRYRRPIVSYRFREPIDLFDRHLYNKGGLVLWMLRQRLGDDAFWGGVRAYLTDHRHTAVHTRQFQTALERFTGASLDRFFDQWIFGAGHPVVEVALAEERDLLLVTVTQKQKGDDVQAAFHFDLVVDVVFEDGRSERVRLPVTEAKRAFALPRSAALKTVRVDPDFRLLAEITITGPTAWLTALLQDPCPVVALRAANALLKTDKRAAVDAVWEARANHPFAPLRAALAERLGVRRGEETRDRLIEALADPNPVARRGVATALGEYRDPTAAGALLAALATECPTWHLQAALCAALGNTRDPRGPDALRRQLGVASWAETVRRGALAGLGATGRVEVLGDLLAETLPDRPDRSRAAAAIALARLADAEESVRRAIVDRLMEMLGEPGFRAQLGAIDALGSLRDRRAEGALGMLHKTAPDGRTRRMAFEAMQRIGKSAADPTGPLKSKIDEMASEIGRLRSRLDRLETPPSSTG